MKKFFRNIFFFITIVFFSVLQTNAQTKIFKITINKEISTTTWQYIKHGLDESLHNESKAVIIELNTYGICAIYAASIGV